MGEEDHSSPVGDVIRRRIEGIRLRKPDIIREVIDVELYSKFDDWPPGERMQGKDALKVEEDALKHLDEYRYSIRELEVKVKGDAAWASFYLNYDGAIRRRSFIVESRVSMILVKAKTGWKIAHEHFSIKPDVVPSLASKPSRMEVKASEETKDELEGAVLKILSDGVERSAVEISEEVSKTFGREVATPKVVEKCRELASRNIIESHGRFYPKYRMESVPRQEA